MTTLPPPARDRDEEDLGDPYLIAEWDSVDLDFRISVRRSPAFDVIRVHDGNRVISADYARAHAMELLAAADRADQEKGKQTRIEHLQNVLNGDVSGTVIQTRDIHGGLQA
jgi:hypothetical protein